MTVYVVVRETPFKTEVLFGGEFQDCKDFATFYLDDEAVFIQELV